MQAVIFDMDGTLIDSEPFWKEAEKHVFSLVGVDVCDGLSAKTAAMTTREVTQFWYDQSPWSGKSPDEVENEVVDRVEALIYEKGVPMEGVKEVLDFFQKKDFKIGLSTNAPERLIGVVLDKLGISHYFHAVSSSEHEAEGKPHPAVYLSTAEKLKVPPSRCIAFEDSLSGVIAAQRAGMKSVIVPSNVEFSGEKFDLSDLKLQSLSDFNSLHLAELSKS
ncbi:hexitol phosphatase HxpB [Marinomonas sp. C2222]|uniref:Hexitol phosphatase HxpB n=1 Tax=Marinomonas sargassi TaxID=2984494 RepID=A0ABT2YV67_9GAMM|nr:hexitol phosphatase HxpB [Marinomonas sargassi]MCV2403792.1 hexitol phosphatase HxpB [Marinomonas sargassi]